MIFEEVLTTQKHFLMSLFIQNSKILQLSLHELLSPFLEKKKNKSNQFSSLLKTTQDTTQASLTNFLSATTTTNSFQQIKIQTNFKITQISLQIFLPSAYRRLKEFKKQAAFLDQSPLNVKAKR